MDFTNGKSKLQGIGKVFITKFRKRENILKLEMYKIFDNDYVYSWN